MLLVLSQLCVGAQKDPNFKTWDEITKSLGHQHRTLDVFKMDIEGHEPGVLAELRHDTPLPRQIVIEIHMRPKDPTGIQRPAPRTPSQLALLMMHMASLGYGIVGQEDNIWGEAGCCAEWTFLHVERPWAGPGARLATYKHRRHANGEEVGMPALQNGTAAGSPRRRLRMQLQGQQQQSGASWLSASLARLWRRL